MEGYGPGSSKNGSERVATRKACTHDEVWTDDEELISVLEEVEAKMMRGGKENVGVDSEGVVSDDDDDCDLVDSSDAFVRPKGYDEEFWEPLINEEYVGSNAIEIMCNNNDAFDHMVLINGSFGKKTRFGGRLGESVVKNKLEWTTAIYYI